MLKLTNKQIKEAKKFAGYMIGGSAQFWSGYGAFALFDIVFDIDFWPAKIASYFIGVSVNFVIERTWVFKQKTTKKEYKSSAKRFYGLMFANFVIDQAIVGGLREVGLTPYIGQFVSAGFFTAWNYLIFKFWVFKRKKA